MTETSGTPAANPADAAASFIDKWRARWPEWGIASVFVPARQHPLLWAWFSLLQELTDATWTGELSPGLAKLVWWQEELQGWSKGARRHPLGGLLQKQPVAWSMLARPLDALPASREQPVATAKRTLRMLAEAIATCEVQLFGGQPPSPSAAQAMAAGLLGERLWLGGDADGTVELLRDWSSSAGNVRARRIHAALLQGRLRTLPRRDTLDVLPPWKVLPLAWKAARGD